MSKRTLSILLMSILGSVCSADQRHFTFVYEATIEELQRIGTRNGVPGLQIVDAAFIREREPHVAGVAALWSPNTGRLDAWRLDWQPGQPKPHIFWDSDTGKWIEAVGYSLASHPNPEFEKQVDEVVDLMVRRPR